MPHRKRTAAASKNASPTGRPSNRPPNVRVSTEDKTNWVRVAVDELSGPTAAANKIGVSGTSIFKWLNLGYVPLSYDCLQLAERSGVPFSKLAGPKREFLLMSLRVASPAVISALAALHALI